MNSTAASRRRRSAAAAATTARARPSTSKWTRPTRTSRSRRLYSSSGGQEGAAPTDEYPTVWRKFARNLVTIEPLATGHYIQEEMPEQCLDRFFVSSNSSWPDSPRLRGCLFVATKRRTGKPRTHSLGCDVSRRRESFPVDAK